MKKLYQVALTYYERHLSIPITGIEGLLRNLIERGEDDGGEDKNISSSPARKRADKIEAEIVLPTNAEFKKLAPSEQKEKFSNSPLEEKKIPILAPTRCKYGWVKEISSPIPASHQLLAISCQRIKKSAASGVEGGRNKKMRDVEKSIGLLRDGYAKPNAFLSSSSSSFWISKFTRPKYLKMSALWIVSNLSILNIESLLRPVDENSGWPEVSRKSAFPIGLDTIEEMKAIIISFFCGLEEMMTAGRTLEEVRSVKGNGMSMMSPRLRAIGLDFFSIKERVDVFFWIIQESEAFRTLSEFTNEHRRDFIIIDSNSNEYFLVFGQLELQVPTEFESTMFINCRNQLSHYNSPPNKDTTFSLESQERATFCDYNYKTKLKKYFVSILTHTNIFDSILVQITRKQCVGIESHLVLAIVAQLEKALKFEEKRKRELSDEIEGFIFTIDLSEAFKKEILKISFSIKENQHQKITSSPILTEFRI